MFHKLWALLRQHVFPRLTLLHLAGLLLCAAGAFSNYRYGQTLGATETEKLIAGAASIGADIYNAVALIAISAACLSRRWIQGAIGAIVLCLTLAYSFNAGLGFATSTISDTVAVRSQIVATNKRVEALGAVEPSGAIKAKMDAIILDSRAGGCQTINGPYTKARCPEYFALKSSYELSLASERLTNEASNKPTVGLSDPLASSVVYFTKLVGIATKEETVRPWQALLFVLLVVLGGPVALWLAESLVPAVAKPVVPAKKASETTVQAETPPSEGNDTGDAGGLPSPVSVPTIAKTPKPAIVEAKPARQSAKILTLTPLATQTLQKILKEGGEVRRTSENAMAKFFDMPRSSMRRAIDRLEQAGQIRVFNDNGFRLAVA